MRVILIIWVVSLSVQVFAQNSKVTIDTNKNLEFLGYIIEQGDPMGNDKNHPVSIIIDMYPENKNSEALFKLFDLASNIDYSTLTNLMYFLPELPFDNNYKVPQDLALRLGFKSKEEENKLNEIVNELNGFYYESNFETIWNALDPYRKNITSFLKDNKPDEKVFSFMEMFYQYQYDQYRIVPIITLWSAGFGIRNYENNNAVFVMGPLDLNYDFNDQDAFINLAIHEFGHSFVNEVVLKSKNLTEKNMALFEPIKEAMVKQGYSNWETCVIEHFVRAGEIIVRKLMGNENQSDILLNDYTNNRKFIYLNSIVDDLMRYRLDKNYSYDKAVKLTLDNMSKMKID